jgi:hypothetical protein
MVCHLLFGSLNVVHSLQIKLASACWQCCALLALQCWPRGGVLRAQDHGFSVFGPMWAFDKNGLLKLQKPLAEALMMQITCLRGCLAAPAVSAACKLQCRVVWHVVHLNAWQVGACNNHQGPAKCQWTLKAPQPHSLAHMTHMS